MKTLHFSPYPISNPRHGGQLRVSAIQECLRNAGFDCINLAFYSVGSYTESEVDQWTTLMDEQFVKNRSNSFAASVTLFASDFILQNEALYQKLKSKISDEKPDVFILEQPWLWPLVKKIRLDDPALAKLAVVYSSQNFEARLFEPVFHFNSGLSEEEINSYVKGVENLEIDLIKNSDLIIAVTGEDSEDFHKFNSKPIVVYRNGINPPATPQNLPIWTNRYSGCRTAFFVSSAHVPNATGVIDLLTPAGFLPPNYRIVIGGQVSVIIQQMEKYRVFKGVNDSRFDFLGVLPAGDLSAMLQIADVIVLPITEGSGSNLKTAEALYSRKSILATSMAMRGYEDFYDSPQISIEDEPLKFKQRLVDLMNEGDYRKGDSASWDDKIESVLWKNRLKGLPDELHRLGKNPLLRKEITFIKGVSKNTLPNNIEIIEIENEKTGEEISAAIYPVSIADTSIHFQICVDTESDDEITTAIVSQIFGLPRHYYMLLDIAPPNGNVLDLGAHIGTFSLFAGANGYHVISVEGSPRNASLLKESILRNGFTNVQVIPAAVSDHLGSLEFIEYGPYGAVSNPFMNQLSRSISVPAITVDSILSDFGWDHVDLIKMDIEGSEVAAIGGMTNLLSSKDAPCILFESNGHTLWWYKMTPRHLFSALETFGYQCYHYFSGKLFPINAKDLLMECVADCLAVKKLPDKLKMNWKLSDPMSQESKIKMALGSLYHQNTDIRAYIGRTLEGADKTFLTDSRIISAIETLVNDPIENVRNSVAWWESK